MRIIRVANYPYYHIRAKNYILADRELLKLQWQKRQFRELIEPRIEKAITVVAVVSSLQTSQRGAAPCYHALGRTLVLSYHFMHVDL